MQQSHWCDNDKRGVLECTQQGIGQITQNDFAREIEKYAADINNKTFLEIGTWNGLGSTKAFVNALSKRTDNYVFYSLECNKDKVHLAQKLYRNFNNVHILNEVIWNETPNDFYQIFPECKVDATYKKWNEIDILNMQQCELFLTRTNLPDIFDVLLLDGGEFTTYYEFQLLKNKCKIIMLDDTNTNKCKLIVNEIKQSNQWNILKDSNERNGYLIAQKK
jgi:hypothetical protein